jgi:hypothetical protein
VLVDVLGDRWRRMTEQLGHLEHVDARIESDGGEGMPKAMEGQRWQSGRLGDPTKPRGNPIGRQRSPQFVGEHQPGVVPRRSRLQLLRLLCRSMPFQGSKGHQAGGVSRNLRGRVRMLLGPTEELAIDQSIIREQIVDACRSLGNPAEALHLTPVSRGDSIGSAGQRERWGSCVVQGCPRQCLLR